MTRYPDNETVPSCDGRCCSSFYLSTSLPELWEQYQQAILGTLDYSDNSIEDIMIIAPMIYEVEVGEEGQKYSCRHWDRETFKCKIYDKRPTMCRDYPYQTKCDYCGWQAEIKMAEPAVINDDYIAERLAAEGGKESEVS